MTKEKKECHNCDDCKKYQDQAFELEVDEDLYQERLNNFWKKYHVLVYTLVFAILAFTAGWQIYNSWHMKVRLAESDMFENAVLQIFAQKSEEGKPALLKLANEGRTGYKYLARLELAGLAARQNDLKTALAGLKDLMESDASAELKTVATLSYVGYQVDTGNSKVLLSLLKPYMDDPAFVGPVADLAVVLYIREDDTQKAKDMLKKMLTLPDISSAVETKLKNLYEMIENK